MPRIPTLNNQYQPSVGQGGQGTSGLAGSRQLLDPAAMSSTATQTARAYGQATQIAGQQAQMHAGMGRIAGQGERSMANVLDKLGKMVWVSNQESTSLKNLKAFKQRIAETQAKMSQTDDPAKIQQLAKELIVDQQNFSNGLSGVYQVKIEQTINAGLVKLLANATALAARKQSRQHVKAIRDSLEMVSRQFRDGEFSSPAAGVAGEVAQGQVVESINGAVASGFVGVQEGTELLLEFKGMVQNAKEQSGVSQFRKMLDSAKEPAAARDLMVLLQDRDFLPGLKPVTRSELGKEARNKSRSLLDDKFKSEQVRQDSAEQRGRELFTQLAKLATGPDEGKLPDEAQIQAIVDKRRLHPADGANLSRALQLEEGAGDPVLLENARARIIVGEEISAREIMALPGLSRRERGDLLDEIDSQQANPDFQKPQFMDAVRQIGGFFSALPEDKQVFAVEKMAMEQSQGQRSSQALQDLKRRVADGEDVASAREAILSDLRAWGLAQLGLAQLPPGLDVDLGQAMQNPAKLQELKAQVQRNLRQGLLSEPEMLTCFRILKTCQAWSPSAPSQSHQKTNNGLGSLADKNRKAK